jgi:hypothetical protein
MEDRRGEDVSDGTPRPYVVPRRGSISYDSQEEWLIEDGAEGTSAIVAKEVADWFGKLTVEAVNAYDRLRAIEAAARAFMEYDDGPPDLPEEEWEPKARVLWDALSEVSSDAR